jgi:LacI family transcriptional regulator
MASRFRVALLLDSSRAYGRGLLHGIAGFVRAHGHWSVYVGDRGQGDAPPAWLKDWKGDGIIARVETRKVADAVLKLGLPAVDLCGLVGDLGCIPLISTDHEAVSRLAFQHFWQRGFRRYAFCGLAGQVFSDQRSSAFSRVGAEAGFDIQVYRPRVGSMNQSVPKREGIYSVYEKELPNWLMSLSKPVALMACNDLRAQQVLSACGDVGLVVPDEVAVVGVDNDDIVCDFADPPLSSVAPDTRRIGYEAAALLERMMRGEPPPAMIILVPPLSLVARRSSDVLAVDDPQIARAARLIREHAHEGITVNKVVKELTMCRSLFERRFVKIFGRSPKEEILRIRLDRIKLFLAETDYSLSQIAGETGFEHPEYMSVIFKIKTGQTPGEYRASARERAWPRNGALKAGGLPH